MISFMPVYRREAAIAAIGMLVSAATAFGADPACGCIFVRPLPPTGISVRRGNLKLPDPPPRVVYSGDLLLIQGHPNAKMACQRRDPDGKPVVQTVVIKAPPNRQAVSCQASASAEPVPVLPDFGHRRLDPHFLSFASGPALILNPWEGRVQQQRPDFRLSLPPNEDGYDIKVLGDQGEIFRRSIQMKAYDPQFKFQYPSDAPPLQVGKTYKLQVSPVKGDRASTDEILFRLDYEDNKAKISDAIGSVDQLDIDGVSKSLLKAAIYGANQLYSEAIKELTSNPDARNDPEALRELGDLYRLTLESRSAEKAYRDSLAPEVAIRDNSSGQGYSWEALGAVHESLGDRDAARSDYQKARQHYTSFSDDEAAKRAAKSIERLEQ